MAVDRSGAVARVTLLGPGKGNAMGPDFWRELPVVFKALDGDESVRAVVLAASGDNFSYGLDLPAMAGQIGPILAEDQGLARPRTKLLDWIKELQASVTAVADCRKPVAAAVQGWCIGGGVDLIAACDVRYAGADAQFSVREVRVGMVADIGSLQRLPAIIGAGHVRELALTGKDITAARAAEIGLVNEVLDDGSAALGAALDFADAVAANPPLVVQGIKQVLDAVDGPTVAEGLRYVATWNAAFLPSMDLGEAMAAFMQRRPPDFTGR
ncbi:crotonase/enoyl-CoA hydratase family protein [Spongisporangium articulatum]|uniref:Crotonase/enoyl-CoA hydratase family protein n=1 Tax=Spongisporangium articulatum TaxID=3362603 RepID=A0ABW8AK74_9ACTN